MVAQVGKAPGLKGKTQLGSDFLEKKIEYGTNYNVVWLPLRHVRTWPASKQAHAKVDRWMREIWQAIISSNIYKAHAALNIL